MVGSEASVGRMIALSRCYPYEMGLPGGGQPFCLTVASQWVRIKVAAGTLYFPGYRLPQPLPGGVAVARQPLEL